MTRTSGRQKKKRAGQPRSVPNLELFKARMEKGLSRENLGELAGLSGKQVGMIERGRATHSRMETLANLAAALERDVFDLFPPHRRYSGR